MRVLVPLLAFCLALAVAAGVILTAQGRPATALYRAVVACHVALEAGDGDAASACAAGESDAGLREALRRRAEEWKGRFWMIRAQAFETSGRRALVAVLRGVGDGRGVEEEEVWEVGPDGRWTLRRWGILDPRPPDPR